MNHYLIIFTSQLHKIKDNFQPFAAPSTCSLRECFVYTKENIFWKPRKAIKLRDSKEKLFVPKRRTAKKFSFCLVWDYLLLVLFTAVLLRYLYAVYGIETFTQINFLSIK